MMGIAPVKGIGRFAFGVGLALMLVAFAAPARADDHHDRGRGYDRDHHEARHEDYRDWDRHEWEAHRWREAHPYYPGEAVIYAPPVIVAPPPPPPSGINLIIPLDFH
ncbi:MAG TPA: hypothetical protein VMV79_06960 [Alphaproteobacteria bacterium]|nr:hypothetical protein [Alphaproteobacteria bacterium]